MLERKLSFELNPKLCKNCLVNLPYEKRHNTFCSRSCAAIFNNSTNPKRVRSSIIGTGKCLFCGNEIKTYKKYCDNKCHSSFKNAEKVQLWLSTGSTGKLDNSSTPWIKNYILNRQNNRCSHCGLSEWRGLPITLELEHKDGNSQNNVESNLECLCPNCHSQTPTYKGKNRGNGRHSRRLRYKQGKSF